jgi:hypothetical protein
MPQLDTQGFSLACGFPYPPSSWLVRCRYARNFQALAKFVPCDACRLIPR